MFSKSFYDATLTINLQALKDNYLLLAEKSSPAICAATIKANAYGVGVDQTLNALYEVGCRDFFVATLGEAIHLRRAKDDINIFVFHGIKENECEAFLGHNIIPVINAIAEFEIWHKFAKSKDLKLKCSLHFDTGINRLGIDPNVINYFNDLTNSNIIIEYVMTHLACANELSDRNNSQYEKFMEITKIFPDSKYCISSSSAIFLDKKYCLDMVRPGAAIFGINPTPYEKINPMKNILKLTAKVIQIKTVSEDGTVGYGSATAVKKGTRLAVLPIGYADGYLRSLTNKTHCYFNGSFLPVVGKISMDMTVLDVSSLKENELNVGDEVEIIGEHLPLEYLARDAGTIAYEILTSFSGRFNKIYV